MFSAESRHTYSSCVYLSSIRLTRSACWGRRVWQQFYGLKYKSTQATSVKIHFFMISALYSDNNIHRNPVAHPLTVPPLAIPYDNRDNILAPLSMQFVAGIISCCGKLILLIQLPAVRRLILYTPTSTCNSRNQKIYCYNFT